MESYVDKDGYLHIEKFKNSKVHIWDFGDFIIVSPHDNLNEIRGGENTDQLLELLVNLAFVYMDKDQINDICKINKLHTGEYMAGYCDRECIPPEWFRFLQYAEVRIKTHNPSQIYEILHGLVSLLLLKVYGKCKGHEVSCEKAIEILKSALTSEDKNFRAEVWENLELERLEDVDIKKFLGQEIINAYYELLYDPEIRERVWKEEVREKSYYLDNLILNKLFGQKIYTSLNYLHILADKILKDKLPELLTSNDIFIRINSWIVFGEESPPSIDKKYFLELLSTEDLHYRLLLWEESISLLEKGLLTINDLAERKKYLIDLVKNIKGNEKYKSENLANLLKKMGIINEAELT
jgi:hypothetical protein